MRENWVAVVVLIIWIIIIIKYTELNWQFCPHRLWTIHLAIVIIVIIQNCLNTPCQNGTES